MGIVARLIDAGFDLSLLVRGKVPGGTMAAACRLVSRLGGKIVGATFVIELSFLNGRGKLPGIDVQSLIQVASE